jgi:copper resistance protein D
MREILLIVSVWIHLFAAVVWIGGIFFILFVALPGARKNLEQPGKFMGDLSKRFTPLANLSILLVFATGIIMSLSAGCFSGPCSFASQILFAKILAVSVMAGIHFYRGLILTPGIVKIMATGDSEKISRLQRYSLNLVRVNFILGMAVLLLTGILYSYKG